MNEAARNIENDYSARPVIHACGVVLEERVSNTQKVEMVYWGKNAQQKITIVVTDIGEGENFYLTPKDDDTMNAFLHPYCGYEKFTLPEGYEGTYA